MKMIFATLATAAILGAAVPVLAARTISYSGQADFRTYASSNVPLTRSITGVHTFRAVFRYDDALEMISGGFAVDGIARKAFTCPAFLGCQPLSIGPDFIGSSAATTPEDGMQIGISSPTMFGGVDLLGRGRQVYDLVPGDESSAFLSFTVYYNPAFGFAYSEGDGTVSRIEAGIPEPATWATMIAGFALAGMALRRLRLAGQRQTA